MSLTFLILLSIFVRVSYAEEDICKGMNHPAYQDEYRACLRMQISKSGTEAGVDCVECLFEQEKVESNSFVQALSVLAQPLAYLAANYTIAKYENATQEKWAQAYASGFQECTNRFNNYLNYNSTIGANPLTSTEAQSFSSSCNGNSYGQYAGYGGLVGNNFGGFSNPFLSQGYSSGYMGVYGGPYALGSTYLYGNGMTSGAAGLSGYAGFNFSAGANVGTGLGTTSSGGGVTTGFGF